MNDRLGKNSLTGLRRSQLAGIALASLFTAIVVLLLVKLAQAAEKENAAARPAPSPSAETEPPARKTPQAASDPQDVRATTDDGDRGLRLDAPTEEEALAEPAESTDSGAPPAPRKVLSPQMERLRKKVRWALSIYDRRMLNTRDHGPWEIMHSIIGLGLNTQVRQGGPRGEPITAIGWLCFNRPAYNQRLFYLSRGDLAAANGPGLQGHDGQFLAMMAQCKLPDNYPIRVGKQEFTIADLVRYEQKTCRPKSELTFKLLALAHYLEPDAHWKSETGQRWSIPRLIQEELAQPIRGATCGGTHRLYALSYAVWKQAQRGEPRVGEYARARQYIRDYQAYTLRYLQNRDGSFSTNWFSGSEAKPDLDRRLKTSGHILEWLAFSLPDDELELAPMVRGVDYIATLLVDGRRRRWEIGPLGHAIHALSTYEQRIFEGAEPAVETALEAARKLR